MTLAAPAGTFRLYDTAARAVRDFVPVRAGEVSIYHCGLTVQAAPHLGHIRKEVVFDVLRRWLTWSGYEVTVIANVTDIDDKILNKSAEEGVPWFAHAYRFERELHDAYAALGCERPTYEPRATGHVPEMIEMIKVLIDRGHAYPAADESGDVYFDVRSWPAYGCLSRQKIADMEPAGDADPRGKRDPRDFALWKGHKQGEPETASWVTPWGRGRPGWHLECSAMAGKYLGDEFDIHGGGLDLRFPHHENELAQSTAAGQQFARFWMHNAMLTTAGEKMSKSLGNGALVSEVIKRFPARAVRLYLVQPHYRSIIEYADDSIAESATALARIDNFVTRATEVVGATPVSVPDDFIAAMNDDLGTPAAVAVLQNTVRDGNLALDAGDRDQIARRLGEVTGMLRILGLNADSPAWSRGSDDRALTTVVDGLVNELLSQRQAARARKDFATADAVRDALARLGVEVSDTPTGFRWSLRQGRSVRSPRYLDVSRRPGTHLAAFSSVALRPGSPPSSALRCTHLNDAKRQATSTTGHRCPATANVRARSAARARATRRAPAAGSAAAWSRRVRRPRPRTARTTQPIAASDPPPPISARAAAPRRKPDAPDRARNGSRDAMRCWRRWRPASRPRPRTCPKGRNGTTGCATSSSWPPIGARPCSRSPGSSWTG